MSICSQIPGNSAVIDIGPAAKSDQAISLAISNKSELVFTEEDL